MPDFDSLYKQWYPQLYGYLVKRVGHQNADDIAQETLVKLWQRQGSLSGEAVRRWIYHVARNAAIDVERHRQTARRSGETDSPEALKAQNAHFDIADPRDEIAWIVERDEIAERARALWPSYQRTVLQMVHGEQPNKMAVCRMRKAYHALEEEVLA